jgi:hypothetical protein
MIIILICCCCNGNGDSMTIDLVDDEIHGSAMIAWLVARGGGWWWWSGGGTMRGTFWCIIVVWIPLLTETTCSSTFEGTLAHSKNRERRKALVTPSVPTKILKAAKFKIFSSSLE